MNLTIHFYDYQITINNQTLIICFAYFCISAVSAHFLKKTNLFFKLFVLLFIINFFAMVQGANRIEITASVLLGFFVIYRENIIELFLDCKYWLESLFEFIKNSLLAIGRLFSWFFGIFSLIPIRREQAAGESRQRRQESDPGADSRPNGSQQSHDREEEIRRAKEELRRMREEQDAADNRSHQQILGLHDGFSKAELEKAYKMAVSRYHPDKYSHMSESFRKEAETELVKVQQAYRALLARVS